MAEVVSVESGCNEERGREGRRGRGGEERWREKEEEQGKKSI